MMTTKRLLDVCDFQGGTQPPKDEWINDPREGYVRMLQIRDYSQGDAKFIQYVKDTKKLHKCTKDDIMLSRYGYIGQAFIGLEGAYNVALVKVIKKAEIHTPYLLCYFQSYYFQHFLLSNVGARATIPGFNKDELENALIRIPEMCEQIEIASKITKVDKLIGFHKQQLNVLDTLIKSRFIELFGTEKEHDKWHCCTVSDVADVCVGVVIKPTQYYTNIGIPAFRSLNIGEMCVNDADWVYFTEEGHRKNQKSVIRKNDVLVVRSGAPGKACVATEKYAGYNAVDIIIAHPDNNKVNSVFLAAFTNMPHGMKQIRAKIGGAAQQHFNVGGYKAMHLITPPIELQQAFAAFVEQVDKSKFEIQQSLEKLEILKKSLMQQYFG